MNLIFVIILMLLPVTVGWTWPISGKINDGNRHYSEGSYDEALKLYRDAEVDAPDSPEIHFNVGNTLYKKGEYDKAVDEYMRAISTAGKDTLLRGKAHYNVGNSRFKQGDIQGSIDSYTEALRVTPWDMDAKFNLEFAKSMLKDMAQDSSRSGEGKEQEGDESSKGEKGKEDQQGARDEKEREMESQQGEEKQEEGEMSEEYARMLLKALDEKEKNMVNLRRFRGGKIHVEKDW